MTWLAVSKAEFIYELKPLRGEYVFFPTSERNCPYPRFVSLLKGFIKKLIERDKVRAENAELKRVARDKFNSIYKLANEALERLDSMWFKPSHAISLVREIASKTN